ncbi:acyl-CoA dehydrogenase family protein [Sphingosinithalassobacter portus]|uniref:acyl-CoA dehydrogenase family protein n=1 Tax=Stakelama portus TaxID=2676234 RepID=UPI001EFD1700|nr:acyl-CoA dehydrogenase family protein [Sphingosinithalassobacter portus]
MGALFPHASPWMDEELVMFDDSVQRALAEIAPASRLEKWAADGIVERSGWDAAAQAGLLGVSVSPEYGGAGGDFRHEAVLLRRLGLIGAEGWGIPLHNAICAAYIEKYGTEEQKQRWLPKIVSGEMITAIAMTEPGAGSDLQGIRTQAVRSGNGYAVTGQKTFITNGQHADLIIVVTKTDPSAGSKGISLIAVEADSAGFSRGRNLDKIGIPMGDTSELFFDNVQVPADNLIGGEEGQGLYQLMKELPKERLMIAVECLALMESAIEHTLAYVRERKAFGKRLLDFQNTQFVLADCKTEATIGRSFVDDCIGRYIAGTLDAPTASMAKYWLSEHAQTIIDRCQQLFGGYGYMNEYPIAQMYKDVRVKRVYGGTSEIMKLLIARTLEE